MNTQFWIKTCVLAGGLGLASNALSEGVADLHNQVPVGQYSYEIYLTPDQLPATAAGPTAMTTMKARETQDYWESKIPNNEGYTAHDFSGRYAIENRHMLFGDN